MIVEYQLYIFEVSKIADQCYLVTSVPIIDKVNSFNKFSLNLEYALLTAKENQCRIYSEKALNRLAKTTESNLYVKSNFK